MKSYNNFQRILILIIYNFSFILAYTITAMHANFVLCLFPSPSSQSSDQQHLFRRCFQSCIISLRRFFRRFCICFVLCVWALSFTSTIPLLYTIDSNEKSPKPVYCPGTTQITYLEEWFDRNRLIQTIIFNLIPLLICIFLSLIALLKLLFDCLIYFYLRLKISKCSPFRKNSTPVLSTIEPYRRWFLTSFLRFILILSCCLLACIYPIVMRFYLIYFSVVVPLIFSIFNYSSVQLTSTQQQTIIENRDIILTPPSIRNSSLNVNTNTILQTNEQFELQTPVISNLLDKSDELPTVPLRSSPILSNTHQPILTEKRKSFANHLYENTRNMII